MCGIVGIASREPEPLTGAVRSATRRMRRRGPDDEGYLLLAEKPEPFRGDDTPAAVAESGLAYAPARRIDEAEGSLCRVALGHRRLSIIDLSAAGHQPMCDPSRRYWVVFNGEIYNHREIRAELEASGHEFGSTSDTEVLLRAWVAWGIAGLGRLNGMFAFAVLDTKTDRLVLVRDRVGIKPLYYVAGPDRFLFASDIKTLLATGLHEPRIDREGLWHNLSFTMTPRPGTSFEGVRAVEPGTWMTVDLHSLEVARGRYWDVPTGVQDESMSEAAAVDLLEAELTRSIRSRLVADVEVGTFMSGGIDSTTVSAIASRIHPGIRAFTLSFDEALSRYDEVEEAKATAALHDMRHVVSRVNPEVLLENLDAIVLGYEEPYHHLAANFAISRVVAEHDIKVVLNGLGGDELFAGYGHYVRVGMWRAARRARGLLAVVPAALGRRVRRLKELAAARDLPAYYAFCYTNLSDSMKADLFGDAFSSAGEIRRRYLPEGKTFTDDLEMQSYLDLKSYIGNHHVHRVDQFTMHFSIEARLPFLDHRLIEAAFTIPSRHKLRGKVQKYVLRKVAEKHIAPACLRMKKKGFSLPLEHWYDHQLADVVRDCRASLSRRGIFREAGIERVFREGTINQRWHLVMTELWLRAFIDGRGAG